MEHRPRRASVEQLEVDFLLSSLANAKLQIAQLRDENQRQAHTIQQLKKKNKEKSSSPKNHTVQQLETQLVKERILAAETAFQREESNHQLLDLKKQLQKAKRTVSITSSNPSTTPTCTSTKIKFIHLQALKSPVRTTNITTEKLPQFVLQHLHVSILCYLSIPALFQQIGLLSKWFHDKIQPPTTTKWSNCKLWSYYIEQHLNHASTSSSSNSPISSSLTPKHRANLWMLATTGYPTPTSTMILEYEKLLQHIHSKKSKQVQVAESQDQDRISIIADVPRTYDTSSTLIESFHLDENGTLKIVPITYPPLESLKNVLLSYLIHKTSTIGYCQGMNFLVGTLLLGYQMAYSSTNNSYKTVEEIQEETILIECSTFFTFLGIMQQNSRYQGNNLYKQGLKYIRIQMGVHEKLTHLYLPDLANHFIQEQVCSDLYSVSWFMTIFTNLTTIASIHDSLKILSSYLINDWKGIHRTALSILDAVQHTLIQKKFADICMILRQPIDVKDVCGRKFKITRRIIKKLTREVVFEEECRKVKEEAERSAIRAANAKQRSQRPPRTPPKTPPLTYRQNSPASTVSETMELFNEYINSDAVNN